MLFMAKIKEIADKQMVEFDVLVNDKLPINAFKWFGKGTFANIFSFSRNILNI